MQSLRTESERLSLHVMMSCREQCETNKIERLHSAEEHGLAPEAQVPFLYVSIRHLCFWVSQSPQHQPEGQDIQVVLPNGAGRLKTSYFLRTNDESPPHIVIQTSGWRTGPPEVLAKHMDPEQADSVDPSEYSFRIMAEMETGDERYSAKINHGMWVGSGMKKGAEVIYASTVLYHYGLCAIGWRKPMVPTSKFMDIVHAFNYRIYLCNGPNRGIIQLSCSRSIKHL